MQIHAEFDRVENKDTETTLKQQKKSLKRISHDLYLRNPASYSQLHLNLIAACW